MHRGLILLYIWLPEPQLDYYYPYLELHTIIEVCILAFQEQYRREKGGFLWFQHIEKAGLSLPTFQWVLYRAWKQELSQSLTNSHGGEKQINSQPPIMLQNQPLEEVESFFYLGSEIGQSRKAVKEVSVRQWLTKYTRYGEQESSKVKSSVLPPVGSYQILVMPMLLYGAETWMVTHRTIANWSHYLRNAFRTR